jgi:hypothetical protein
MPAINSITPAKFILSSPNAETAKPVKFEDIKNKERRRQKADTKNIAEYILLPMPITLFETSFSLSIIKSKVKSYI